MPSASTTGRPSLAPTISGIVELMPAASIGIVAAARRPRRCSIRRNDWPAQRLDGSVVGGELLSKDGRRTHHYSRNHQRIIRQLIQRDDLHPIARPHRGLGHQSTNIWIATAPRRRERPRPGKDPRDPFRRALRRT
jgi:hypothetical protein